jgi:predicted HTH domain antitoxin
MANLSVRMKKEMIDELDQLAKLRGVDRATIVRKIIDNGIENQRIELALELYQKGTTLERAANISRASLWDLMEEIKKRGITSKFDIEEEKDTIVRIFAKDDKELEKKIRNL